MPSLAAPPIIADVPGPLSLNKHEKLTLSVSDEAGRKENVAVRGSENHPVIDDVMFVTGAVVSTVNKRVSLTTKPAERPSLFKDIVVIYDLQRSRTRAGTASTPITGQNGWSLLCRISEACTSHVHVHHTCGLTHTLQTQPQLPTQLSFIYAKLCR